MFVLRAFYLGMEFLSKKSDSCVSRARMNFTSKNLDCVSANSLLECGNTYATDFAPINDNQTDLACRYHALPLK